MKIQEIADALERFAPLPLQEGYDNAGLQIGLTEGEEVSGVLLCLDVTEAVIAEAHDKGCNLIVSHHPLIFRPLRHVTIHSQVERCVVSALRNGIAIYSAHTNLDNAPGGVNFMMAERLELTEGRFLQPNADGRGGSGLIGKLSRPLSPGEFLKKVRCTFSVDALLHNRVENKEISIVALCGGAGDFLIDKAVSEGADAFLTGEVGYHRYFGHEHDILIASLGHYQSEQYTIQLLLRILRAAFPTLKIVETSINTNPVFTN